MQTHYNTTTNHLTCGITADNPDYKDHLDNLIEQSKQARNEGDIIRELGLLIHHAEHCVERARAYLFRGEA